jgi:hypothetical protein
MSVIAWHTQATMQIVLKTQPQFSPVIAGDCLNSVFDLIKFCIKGQKGQKGQLWLFKGCSSLPMGHPDEFLFYASKLLEGKFKSYIRKDCFQVKSNLLTAFRFTTHMNIMILN